jgi:hypothetical protein
MKEKEYHLLSTHFGDKCFSHIILFILTATIRISSIGLIWKKKSCHASNEHIIK